MTFSGEPDCGSSVAVGLVAEALAGVRIVAEALNADDQDIPRRERATEGHWTGKALRAEPQFMRWVATEGGGLGGRARGKYLLCARHGIAV
jgi:hypothetical protein